MMMKEIVLFAAGALCALNATYEQKPHANSHNNGNQTRIRHKPMNK
jgi:hypothetical protein